MLLSEIAERLGLKQLGPDLEIEGVNTLESAGKSELSFLVNPKYSSTLASTEAGAVLCSETYASQVGSALVSDNVYLDLAGIVRLFEKKQGDFSGISQMARIHDTAKVDETATIYPYAYIGPDAEIGPGVTLYPGAYVGPGCTIGQGSILYPNCVLMAGTELGENVIIQPGAVLGGDGFGYAQGPAGHMKIPQIGRVLVENDVEIGSNSAVDRAALDTTTIGQGTKMDNLVQIGHNVSIGAHCLVVAQVGIGGSTKIGNGVVIGGQAGFKDNVTVGDGCQIGGKAGIVGDLDPGATVTFNPHMDINTYLRVAVLLPKLPKLMRKMKKMEKEIARLTEALGSGEDE